MSDMDSRVVLNDPSPPQTMGSPEVVKQQVQVLKEAEPDDHHFTPANGLPVVIDFVTQSKNPYAMATNVIYNNGIVKVEMDKGFQWDGASIPYWLPVVPWLASILLVQFFPSLWWIQLILIGYTLRLLPYMQRMGLHARGMAVHDALYRKQRVSRVVSDAIMAEILEKDGVPWDVRWLIYRRLRQFGWWAWRNNRLVRLAAGKPVIESSKQPLVSYVSANTFLISLMLMLITILMALAFWYRSKP